MDVSAASSNKTIPYNGTFGYDEIERYDTFVISLYMNKSGLWILTIIGLFCNTLAFLTIRLVKPFGTHSFYVALLAVLDTLVLVARLLYQQLTAYDIPMGDVGCAFFTFLGSFVLHLSIWTLVVINIERFVAVFFPHRFFELFTMRRAKLSIIIIAFLLIVLNMHLLWMNHEYYDAFPQIGLTCGFRPEYKDLEKYIWYWVNSCLYAFLPCATLIFLNAMIIHKLKQSFKMQKGMTTDDCSTSNLGYQNRQITVMLVKVSVFFAIFLLPVCIFHLVALKWNWQSSPQETARYYLTTEIVFFLAEIHHAVNFVVYVYSNENFRKVAKRLVTC